ncbi:hypothetical protein [Streptomyces prasinus]|nr:hypothetical protein [Streptomyces prasinus]
MEWADDLAARLFEEADDPGKLLVQRVSGRCSVIQRAPSTGPRRR